jgi:hypothetical protein
MIRHKPKPQLDINQLLINLEQPTQDNIDELNRVLGRYLDKVAEPLNLSFWQTVNVRYWTYLNLLKLTDKLYDTDPEAFIKQIYDTANDRIKNSPKIGHSADVPVETSEDAEESENSDENQPTRLNSWLSYINTFRPVKYVVGGAVALVVVGVTVNYIKADGNSI